MRTRTLVVMLACLAASAVLVVDAPSSDAGHAVTLHPPRVTESATVYRGRAHPDARVRLQRRTPDGWVRLAATRTSDRGVYRMTTRSPADRWRVRVVGKGARSPVRTVVPSDTLTSPESEEPPQTPEVVPSDACGERPAKADGSLWACTFHDEFDGSALDTSKWLVQETWYSGMTSGNADCYVPDRDTITVGGGTLELTARHQLEAFTCTSPYGDFVATSTAATVATRDRFTQTYGRFAFRARFPDTAGLPGPHSALWLYPQDHGYGPWPHSGEIDVAEWFSARPANVYPSVHYAGENPMLSSGGDCPMPTAGTAYHTYAVEWTPTEMRFFYDDRLCFEHAWTPSGLTAPQPFDRPFYIVLTQVWGDLWNAVSPETPTSATLSVDWVRAWE